MALTLGEYTSVSGGVAYSNVGTVTKGPYVHSDSVLLGMSVTLGELSVDSYGDATCPFTLSGTPTSTGTIVVYILIEYNQLSNGEAVVGNGSYSVKVVEEGATIPVEKIDIHVPTGGWQGLKVGATATLYSSIQPSDATNQNRTWSIDLGEGLFTMSSTTGKQITITGVSPGACSVRLVADEDPENLYDTQTFTVYAADSGSGGTTTTRWIKINYDANGGICTAYYAQARYGSQISGLPAPPVQIRRDTETRDGKIYIYEFAGWWTSPTGGSQIENGDYVTFEEDEVTIYAHWIATELIVPSDGDGANAEPTARKGFSILISDNTGDTFYTMLGNVTSGNREWFYNCLSSLSITGGPEDPFEYLTLTVPKKRLEYVAAELVEANGILPGVTKIQLDCMGRGMFTVTKCRYSGRRYTITAYCDAERFRGVTNDKELTGMPWTILMEILEARSEYGISISYVDTEDLYDASVSTRCTESVTFDKDTNLWYIMQVCAMLCRCRIWFSDDTVHIRDCTKAVRNRVYSGAEAVDLYPESTSDAMYARVTDEVDLGDEGADTVVNSVTIRCANSAGTMANIGPLYGDGTTTKPTKGSVAKFGERTEQLSIPELGWTYDTTDEEAETTEKDKVSAAGSIFAQNYIGYLSEPQQSIEFTVKEMQETEDGEGYEWLSYFDDPSMATEIVDVPDEVHLTNESVCDQGTLPQKLMLSTRTRHYPDCTTTYTFGQMKSITLSDSTSRIMDALNKG